MERLSECSGQLLRYFEQKMAHEKLACWRQIKVVVTFDDDFQKILQESLIINYEEQLDRSKTLELFFERNLHKKLQKAFRSNEGWREKERVEITHPRARTHIRALTCRPRSNTKDELPAPKTIGDNQHRKLFPAERNDFIIKVCVYLADKRIPCQGLLKTEKGMMEPIEIQGSTSKPPLVLKLKVSKNAPFKLSEIGLLVATRHP